MVVKRDGRLASFDKDKIKKAIISAFIEVDGEETSYSRDKANEIARYVYTSFYGRNVTVEEIQKIVEDKLMASNRKDVARSYIIYRNNRDSIRQSKNKLMKDVANKLTASNVQNQNANVDEESFGGRMGEANEVVTKNYALYNIVSKIARNNHLNNIAYLHDLGHYAIGDHNCLSVPFDKLLSEGFNTKQTDVRPANSVSTALQLIAVIFQLQSLQQFGGVSATHLDWTLVPYVRKSFWKHFKNGLKYVENQPYRWDKDFSHIVPETTSIELPQDGMDCGDENNEKCSLLEEHIQAYEYAMDMTIKECEQAVEGMYHNLNTLQSRSGNQLPFTSINYGTCTLLEGRMVIKALLEGSIKGVGKHHKTSIFPCGIFQCMKGVNRQLGDPNYDLFQLALKSTSQRLYPNYANVDWSGNAGYDINDPKTYFSTMGCRTANGWDANGFGQLKDGRGNICPSTIIMPTIAMMAKDESEKKNKDIVEVFMNLLDKVIHETKNSLIERYQYICSQSPNAAKFMYENNVMAGYVPEEGIRSALKHGTLAIGQIGLAETLQILIGCDHTEERGMELAKRIEQLFKDRCAEFKTELHRDEDGYEYYLNFGVYLTPAENLAYTSMKKFKETYGVIKNVSDKDYFTNSIHVPVWKKMSPFKKIDIEAQLTGYSSAGCITYIELDSKIKNNLEALEEIVNYAMDKDIPYFAVNVPNDQCMNCSYIDDIAETCPICDSSNIRRIGRVTGYLGDVDNSFNYGKQCEYKMRIKHWIMENK